MEVRGAPLIGGTAAYGIGIGYTGKYMNKEFINKSAERINSIKTYSN